jgi:nucleotide-binding universal stress UspA family protein
VSHQLVEHAPCPVVVVPEDWEAAPTRRVVVGVDGSGGAQLALRWALDWAEPERAEIDVVLAVESDLAWIDVGSDYEQRWVARERAAAEAELRSTVDEVVPRSRRDAVHVAVEAGPPASALVDRAKDADLLVVGTRGRGGFAGLLLGSVSQRCAEHSPCPVAVVPPPRTNGASPGRR